MWDIFGANCSFELLATSTEEKNALYLSVKVFSAKILIGDTIFTWWSEPREGLAACNAKGVPSFLKTLSIGPAVGIEPATWKQVNSALKLYEAHI